MAQYRYKCSNEDCGVEIEHLQPMVQPLPDSLTCPKCGLEAKFLLQGAPAVSTIGMGHAPLDVVVGRDAAARWEDINHRQEIREKVRTANSNVGLTATGRNEFQPLSAENKAKRTESNKVLERDGHKPAYDGNDSKLVKFTR